MCEARLIAQPHSGYIGDGSVRPRQGIPAALRDIHVYPHDDVHSAQRSTGLLLCVAGNRGSHQWDEVYQDPNNIHARHVDRWVTSDTWFIGPDD